MPASRGGLGEMEDGMGKLILVRHGHTRFNGGPKAAKRLRGWIDVPLDKQGLREAEIASEWVGANHDVEAVYTSDLVRARRLAAEVEKRTGVASVVVQRLRPWNVGRLAGRRVADILGTLEILNQNPDIPAPSGESYWAFFARYGQQLAELLELADQTPRTIVAVTHIRNLLATPVLLRKGPAHEVPVDSTEMETGTAMVVERQDGRWRARLEGPVPAVPAICAPVLLDPVVSTAPAR
jgi:broad specificity phosphatase PhoE